MNSRVSGQTFVYNTTQVTINVMWWNKLWRRHLLSENNNDSKFK